MPFAWNGDLIQRIDVAPFTLAMEYDASNNLIYLGRAVAGSATDDTVWQISKCTYTSGNLTAVQWASGTTNFDKVWDDRASYTYS